MSEPTICGMCRRERTPNDLPYHPMQAKHARGQS